MLSRFVAVLAVFVMLASGSAFAAGSKTPETTKNAGQGGKSPGNRISLEKAQQIALESYPGTVLDAEKEDDLYEIKVRTEKGDVVKLKIDPVDGSVVSFKKKTQKN